MIPTRFCAMVAAGMCAFALAACEGQSDAEKLGTILYHKIFAIGGAEEVPRARVVAIPYATLGVQFGSSDQAMFVLAGKSGSELEWVGGTQFAISTRDGRIARTAGFPHNLGGIASDPDSTATLRIYRYDLPDINAYGIVVSCNVRDLGEERLTILEIVHDTRHVAEECTAPQVSWDFTNEFWLEQGAILRSIQYVHPGVDPVTLETLRPAG